MFNQRVELGTVHGLLICLIAVFPCPLVQRLGCGFALTAYSHGELAEGMANFGQWIQ